MKSRASIVPYLAVLLICIPSLLAGISFWVVSTVALYAFLGGYCATDIREHIFLLLFALSYFIFLVGGIVVKEYFGYDMAYSFSPEDYNYMAMAVFAGLASVFAGYLITHRWKKRAGESGRGADAGGMETIRKLVLYSYFVLLVPYLATFVEAAIAVRRHGYSEYYTFESRFPVLQELADLYIISFCAFLATLPSKKQAKWPLIVFSMTVCASLLTGRRLFFVVDSLLLVGYFFLRNRLDPQDPWISKRHFLLLALIVPFLMIFLYAFESLRVGESVTSASLGDAFLSVFKQQGYSANLIPLGRIHLSGPDHPEIYSFYDIIRFLRINVLSRFLNGGKYLADYTGTPLNLALHSGSFARAISWAVQKWRYLDGFGMGSCCLAELLHDFGWIGLFAGCALYGATLSFLGSFSETGFVKNTVFLLMARDFFKSPRYCYDSPFYVVFSISLWIYFLAILLAARMAPTRRSESLHLQGPS